MNFGIKLMVFENFKMKESSGFDSKKFKYRKGKNIFIKLFSE